MLRSQSFSEYCSANLYLHHGLANGLWTRANNSSAYGGYILKWRRWGDQCFKRNCIEYLFRIFEKRKHSSVKSHCERKCVSCQTIVKADCYENEENHNCKCLTDAMHVILTNTVRYKSLRKKLHTQGMYSVAEIERIFISDDNAHNRKICV